MRKCLNVLFVDSEPLIADTLAKIFNIHGYESAAAYDGIQAYKGTKVELNAVIAFAWFFLKDIDNNQGNVVLLAG